jgi:hypothetical protein
MHLCVNPLTKVSTRLPFTTALSARPPPAPGAILISSVSLILAGAIHNECALALPLARHMAIFRAKFGLALISVL